MPRGLHENSKKALAEGRKSFSKNDSRASKAGKRSAEVRGQYKRIAEELLELASETDTKGNTRRKYLAAKLMSNMEKSPQWFELGLKVLGEMPEEKVAVSVDAVDSEETKRMIAELRSHVNKTRGNQSSQ